MQQKLKAVFRSASRKKGESTDQIDHNSEASSPRSSRDYRQATSFDEPRHRRASQSNSKGAHQNGRIRPVSSAYDSRRVVSNGTGSQPVAVDYAQAHSSEPASESIASNYKAYLPVLSPVEDPNVEPHMTLGGDRRLISGESEGRHEEDVADRNIERYRTSLDASKEKPLPAPPVVNAADEDTSRKRSTGDHSFGSTLSSIPSAATGKYSVGGNTATKGGLVDSIKPHTEAARHEKNQWKTTNLPLRTARDEPQVGQSKRTSHGMGRGEDEPQSPPRYSGDRHVPQVRSGGQETVPMVGVDGQADIEREIQQLLHGVVDLRNTVDEDKDVQWAPAVTHEVVKPHVHEIIQRKIYREIHNYEYYHHIQPVYDIEVLPPRHWIPNPNGEGLVEISADELPSRTGNNRRWKIVQEQEEPSSATRPAWRTEPEIIEHPATFTEEGFERKETTIIYPPKLQDMTEYDGLIQPVHFDHKTGERWLGEITTMHKLRQELGQVADPDPSLKEPVGTPHEVPDASEVPDLSQSPLLKRKPVKGPVHATFGGSGGREEIAVAI